MNHQRIYDFLIERARTRVLTEYTERHHIHPRCLGGSNRKENIVRLTAKEHYIVHRLLVYIYPEEPKLVYAFWMMCNGCKKGRQIPSPRIYEEVRIQFSKIIQKRKHNKRTKNKISQSKKGQQSWLGKTHSENSKKKQSIAAQSRKISSKTENKRRKNISKKLLNKPKSKSHRENISAAKLGKNNPMYGTRWKLENGKRIYYDRIQRK